jgi:hypothetical protein
MAKKKWSRDINAAISAVQKSEEPNYSNQGSENWKPTKIEGQDRTSYIVRILPDPGSDDGTDWVLRKAHMINFPGGKRMYEPCPKKTRGECPICDHVSPLFKSGNPDDERIAYDHYAKKRYFMNILIVSDERDGNANEGQVRLWECPKKVMEEILLPAMKEDKIMFSDPYTGANLKLVVKTESGFPNYGMSRLQAQEPIGDDDEIDDIMEKAIDLREKLLSEKCFKTTEELWHMYTNNGERLATGNSSSSSAPKREEAPAPKREEAPAPKREEAPAPKREKPPKEETPTPTSQDIEDDEDFDISDEDFDISDDEIEDMVK